MNKSEVTLTQIESFRGYLINEERSKATIEKYVRDVKKFYEYLPDDKLADKELVLGYKSYLADQYKPASVNSMLAALNSFFMYLESDGLKVKLLKQQKSNFISKELELSKEEYCSLVEAARLLRDEKWDLIIETICSTGIRVGELKYITVEAVQKGKAEVNCKGKLRTIIIPSKLQDKLRQYCDFHRLQAGCVFVTCNGNPVNRCNIWRIMKQLCTSAGISEKKVFPHNLRHLFARTYYDMQGDIVHLADILGHSSIETTRIYTLSSSGEQAERMERMELVL